MLYGVITFEPITYGPYVYPTGANVIGWFIAGSSIICIPLFAVYGFLTTSGSPMEVKISTITKKLNSFACIIFYRSFRKEHICNSDTVFKNRLWKVYRLCGADSGNFSVEHKVAVRFFVANNVLVIYWYMFDIILLLSSPEGTVFL
jgi:hypothetical protein